MTRRPARLAALLAPVLLAAGCAGTASESSPLTRETCADLVVVGARGSTQSPDRNLGVGTEVRVSVDALAARLRARSGTTVRLEAVRYDASAAPSIDAFEAQARAGAQMMSRRLARLEASCPRSRFALVGFSQGAEVVHLVAADLGRRQASRVDLVAMIADPRRDPDDRIAHWSYGSEPPPHPGLLGAGPPVDRDLRDVAVSLCVPGDDVCDARPGSGGGISPKHEAFYEQPSHARATAARLDAVLRRADA